MFIRRTFFLCAILLLFFLESCAPKPHISTVKDEYGCDQPPADVFTTAGIDLKVTLANFADVVAGNVDLKTNPEVLTTTSTALQDDRIRAYLRCVAINRDGYTLEQAAYFETLSNFMKTDPTPKDFISWQEKNPFPPSTNQGIIPLSKDQHVKPDISSSMGYPIKVKDDKVFRNKRNPVIIVKNNGPIKAVSVAIDIKIYVYNAEKDKIIYFIDFGFRGFDHAVSAKELEPFDQIRQSSMGINGKDLIAVYSVNVSYHRESDMKPFLLQEYFYTENRKIIADNEFRKDSRYNQIIEKVKSFDPSEISGSKFMLTAAAEHRWFFESDPSVKVRKNPDGSVTVATPKEQGETPQGGYPFLDIKPHPFKATGFYTKARIVEDHIEVKIAVEVRNIGDTAAIITENGFDPTGTIEPGRKKYYTRTQMVERKKGNQQPLENFIKLLDTEDIVFRARLSFLYRPANDIDKLFKSTIHYGIGRNKVMPIPE